MKLRMLLWMMVLALYGAAFPSSLFAQEDGEVVKVIDNLDPFTEIQLVGVGDVVIVQAEPAMVVLEIDAEFQDKVVTRVTQNRLYVEAKGITPQTFSVTIQVPQCTLIAGSGAVSVTTGGTLHVNDLLLDFSGASDVELSVESSSNIQAEVSGASNMVLRGRAASFVAHISGAADLQADELMATNAYVSASGASDAYVYAEKEGIAETSGAAEVNFVKTSGMVRRISSGGSPVILEEDQVILSPDEGVVDLDIGNMGVTVKEDSVRFRIGGREVVVDEERNVNVRKVRKSRFNGHWGGVHLGVNGLVNNNMEIGVPSEFDFMDQKYQRSMEFNLNLYEQNFNLIKNRFGLITGIGFRWNNYFFKDNAFIRGDSSTVWGYRENVPGRRYEKSKLVVSYLSIPLLMEFQTNRYSRSDSFHLTMGMVMGVQLRSHTKNLFYDGEGKNKNKGWEDYNLSPFRWDLHASIGWQRINLYASYALNSLFLADKGPEVYPFSVGIALWGW